MATKIQVTAAENAELTQSIDKMKESLEEVKSILSSLKDQLHLLEGKGAKALQSAVESTIQQINHDIESWGTLKDSAQKIYEGIKEADDQLGS